MFEGFERREMLSVTITPIADVSVPATKTSFVPVQGTDSAGNRIDYTVTSGNASVQATVRSGHPFLKLSVANYGDMVFQLFDDLAPNTVTKIKSLVDSGFYNGLTFHRVVPNFVIQGGDPKGDGTGGPGFSFDNEYNANAIFSGSGQLAMANSGPNTNGSQFFVTVGPQRFLDFNYNLFGQLVSGESVLKAIDSVPTNSADRPLSTVTITNASIINDNSDTVLLIKAPAGSGSSTITVTGTDSVDNSTDQETFQVNYQADTTVDPPFLNPIGAQSTKTDTPVSFTLSSTDLQNNPVTYSAKEVGGSNAASVVVNGNVVTVTPKTGYEGTIQVQVAVQAAGATSRGSTADPKDYKTISVKVAAETTTPPPVTTPPTNTTSTGNPRVFVRAPSGVSQHAINLTSRELSRVLGTLHKVMVRFRITGDKTRLEHALTVLAGRIPYGRRNLLPVWKATLAAADTGTAAGRKALGGQLKNNLVTYLSNQIGVTLNVVHSHGSYWSDRLVKFNGRA